MTSYLRQKLRYRSETTYFLALKRQNQQSCQFLGKSSQQKRFYSKTSKMTSRQKTEDVIFPPKNVSIVLSICQSAAKIDFHANFFRGFENWNLFFPIWPISTLLWLTAMKIATVWGPRCGRSNYFFAFNVRRKAHYTLYMKFQDDRI